MNREIIRSRSNPLVKRIRALHEAKGRREAGEFLLEGERFVRDAIISGFHCRMLVAVPKLAEAFAEFSDVVPVSDEVFAALSDTRTPQGILGIFALPEEKPDALSAASRILCLEGVQQSDNVGALLRSAVCCGYELALLLGSCADPYSPKSVRASAGAVLRINILRGTPDDLAKLRESGAEIIGAHLSGSEQADYLSELSRFVLIIGSEGRGMSEGSAALCTKLVRIPLLGDCESLNAAVAGGILMYKTIGY